MEGACRGENRATYLAFPRRVEAKTCIVNPSHVRTSVGAVWISEDIDPRGDEIFAPTPLAQDASAQNHGTYPHSAQATVRPVESSPATRRIQISLRTRIWPTVPVS